LGILKYTNMELKQVRKDLYRVIFHPFEVSSLTPLSLYKALVKAMFANDLATASRMGIRETDELDQ
jgi:hypothetical protein